MLEFDLNQLTVIVCVGLIAVALLAYVVVSASQKLWKEIWDFHEKDVVTQRGEL